MSMVIYCFLNVFSLYYSLLYKRLPEIFQRNRNAGLFSVVVTDFGDQISATIIATGIKSADITGNARTGFAAAKKPVQQTQQAPEFSGQPLHNGKVMEEEQPVQTTSYVSEPEMKEIEQESSKINIPEFLLKSRRR